MALELILSIGILPRGLHRLSFPSIAKDQTFEQLLTTKIF
jgi:hypothetical protein